MSSLAGFKLFLNGVVIFPARLNYCLDGELVAGIAKYFLHYFQWNWMLLTVFFPPCKWILMVCHFGQLNTVKPWCLAYFWYTALARLTCCFWPPLRLIPYNNIIASLFPVQLTRRCSFCTCYFMNIIITGRPTSIPRSCML